MKKLICVLLTLGLVLGLTGCAREDPPVSSTPVSQGVVSSEAGESAGETTAPTPTPTPIAGFDADKYGNTQEKDVLYPYSTHIEGGFRDLSTTVMEDGMFMWGAFFIHYVDFASGANVYFCPRPTCRHDTYECEAYWGPMTLEESRSLSSYFKFIANGRYFSTGATVMQESKEVDGFVPVTELKVSRLDRTGEKTIGSFKGAANEAILYGNSMYIFTVIEAEDPEHPGSGGFGSAGGDSYSVGYLTEIDLKEEKVVREIKLAEGYGVSAHIWYMYGNNAYLSMTAYSEPVDYLFYEGEETQAEYDSRIESAQSVSGWYRMDLTTEEVFSQNHIFPEEYEGTHYSAMPKAVWKDWCVYEDGHNKLMAQNMKTGEERLIHDGPIHEVDSQNNFNAVDTTALYYMLAWDDNDLYRYDFESGETTRVTGKDLGKIVEVFGETDQYLYVRADPYEGDFWKICKLDISKGFEDCPWEEMKTTEDWNRQMPF